MAFQKGQSGNPAGRPEGSKNKNRMNAVFWWNFYEETLLELSPDKRAEKILAGLQLLMPKVNNLPVTPDDSVANADQAFGLMRQVAPINPPLQPNPNTNGGTNGSNGG